MNFDVPYLVIDRTKADVDAGNQKGTYNASDLNRVENAMSVIASRLTEAGYAVSITTKTDWSKNDVPPAAEMDRYLRNLAALRSAFAMPEQTPEAPADMERLTYQEANNIEKILEEVAALLINAECACFCSGDLYSGEV